MLHRFFGGVHPAGHKEATQRLPTVPLNPPPAQVIIPMHQHVGGPCVPTVNPGDKVVVGQVIGEPASLGALIHASVSGTVVAVEPRPHPGGTPVMSVVIDNDGLNTAAEPIPRPAAPAELTPEQVVEIIRLAGITGMGGAGFPTHVKLHSAIGKVDTLLLNGAECEPYITVDHRLMLEQPGKILGGAQILMRALGLKKCTIGVEANKMDAVETLRALNVSGIEILPLRVRYPQGSEKQLIQYVTGRQVRPGGLPASVGCAVFNVTTAAAIYDAVYEGKPLTHRAVTVSGKGICEPKNLLVPIGTPYTDLINAAGGFKGAPGRIVCGGPMMGISQFDLSAPVIKGNNALLAFSRRELPRVPAHPTCIRCGRCVSACPMHLTPLYFHQRVSYGRFEELEPLRVLDCVECGACAYACPAGIPLVASIRTGKAQLKKLQFEAKEKAMREQEAKEKEEKEETK